MNTYQDYIDAIRNNVGQRVLKINLLDENYNILSSIEPKILDGNISLSSGSGSRRSASITFENSKGEFFPSPTTKFWLNTRYQIFTGMYVNGEAMYHSRGIFLSGQPTVKSSLSDKTVELQLYDIWNFLDGSLAGNLENTYPVPQGSNIESTIRQVLIDAGITRPPIIEPLSGAVTPYTLIVENGESYASILIKLSEMLSMICFFDNDGFFRMQSPPNNLTNIFNAGSVWDFSTNEVTYLGGDKKLDYTKVKNTCVCVGSNLNGLTYRATSSDTNVSSPTRVALIGKRVQTILDDMIYSTDLAKQRADFELSKSVQILEEINIEAIPIDTINPDDVITLLDASLDVNDRYLVRSVNFPLLTGSSMTLGIWLARSFS